MPEPNDIQLLRDYAERQSEAAFAELVRRHVNLVHSVAMRQTGNPHQAEEITQAVFIILARKAGSLSTKTVLSGWLYHTARLTAANVLRTDRRRTRREQEAYMQSLLNEPRPDVWPQIKPLLDDAMAKLGDKDRDAIVLRFFEGKSLSAVGAALGASEDAAKMRVNRALERLRSIFARRGVALSTTAVGSVIAANAVQAAPTTLAASVLATAGGGTIVAASTLTLVKGVLEFVTITKLKLGVIGAIVAVSVATPLVLQQQANARLRDENRALHLQAAQPPPEPTPQLAVDETELARMQQDHLELLRLRGEVGRLRTQEKELAKLRPAGRNSSVALSATPPPKTIELPKDAWSDAGFTTPEAVLQTRGWSVVNGNRDRFKESLHITDGAKKILEGMVEQMIASAPDPASARKQIADNGLGMEDAMLFPMIAENQNKNYTGYRVLSQQSPSTDEKILEVETTMDSGIAKQETLKFQRFGDGWKVVLDEEAVRAQLQKESK